jgi:hypothetical protein
MRLLAFRARYQRAQQIAVPSPARARSTLERIDYADAFLVDVGPVAERTAERWARAVLEEAPGAKRRELRSGWSALGLILDAAPPERSVLGWEIRRSSGDFVLLAAASRIGMPGQLLFERQHNALLFCTFVQHGNPFVRSLWAGVNVVHVPTVRDLLEQAATRCRS